MTSSHLDAVAARAYRDHTLQPEELLRVDEHLATCAECRTTVLTTSSRGNVAELLASLGQNEDEHLDYARIAAHVDGTLDAGENAAVLGHIAHCEACSRDVADLRETADAIGVRPAEKESTVVHPFVPRRSPRWLPIAAIFLVAILGLAVFIATRRLGAPENQPMSITSIRDADGTVGIDSAGTSAVASANGRDAALLRLAWTHGVIPIAPRARALRRSGGTLLGTPTKAFEVVAPIATLVRETRPHFEWNPLADGAEYHVEVYDENGTLALRSDGLHTLGWTADHDLARGRDYVWQVVAESAGQRTIAPAPPAAEAHFGVLDLAAEARVAEAEQRYKNSHLMRGLVDAREGLLTDARTELTALRQLNPNSPQVRVLAERISH